ncbi:serpin B12-like [Neodiprion fabricii]|uniref:serpin B12-like n=1 Tax=Neodiprion fabricii TaxID=2872261 RepID=UPI001ED924B9|nr:serpin B12-like [Neodiprion fabricii]
MILATSLVAVALATTISAESIVFDKPKFPAVDPYELPSVFQTRVADLQKYPLAVEAVLSVALKLQAIEDRSGKQKNFLVSPLAVAGALGQLMLGARGDMKNQLAILLTLHDNTQNSITNTSEAAVEQRIANSSATSVEQRVGNPEDPSLVKGSGNVVSRFRNTVSAQDAWSYEPHRIKMHQFATKTRDGSPGLELHRQLGSLINELSTPLPPPGVVHSLANRSYLHTSSAFFVDKNMNLNDVFVRAVVDFYQSRVMPLDFRNNSVEAQNEVNRWGSMQTGGLIDRFLAFPPPPDTAVIQAVTVHFRGAWQTPFIPGGTIGGLFKTSENTTVSVNMMRGTLEEATYAEDNNLGLRMLVMPYSNYECAMYVILPTETNPLKYNVGHLVTQLTSKNLVDLAAMGKKRTVNVMFPKLSLTGSLNLASALEEHAAFLNKEKAEAEAANGAKETVEPVVSNLNLTSPTPNQITTSEVNVKSRINKNASVNQKPDDVQRVIPLNASQPASSSESTPVLEGGKSTEEIRITSRIGEALSDPSESKEPLPKAPLILAGAAKDSKFRISDIIQQIALEVNEAGTEAAAIVGTTINYSGGVKNFKVNRPFLFFIRHEETHAILFWGTIVDPTA